MESTKNLLDNLKKQLAQQKISACRVASLPDFAEKQMHLFPERKNVAPETDIHDYFFLIIGIDKDNCQVIPGSLDGMMAGPDDIVLPKSVLGQYIFLSPDLATTVPVSALGRGFAVLDESSYRRVLASCPQSSLAKKNDAKPFPHALPYISIHDDRRAYRANLQTVVNEIQVRRPAVLLWPEGEKSTALSSPKTRHALAIAASFLVVGAIVAFSLFEERKTQSQRESVAVAPSSLSAGVCAPPESTCYAPSGVMRGKKEQTFIFSPQQTISTTRPDISIGGDPNVKYTVKITNLDGELIVEKEFPGGSTIPWPASDALGIDDAYTIALFVDNSKISEQKFWISNDLMIAMCKKYSACGFRIDNQFERAKHFYDAQYYSEAYLLFRSLVKNFPENSEYREWLEMCLKKLK